QLQEYINIDNTPVDDLELLKQAFPEYQFVIRDEFITFSRYPIINTFHQEFAYMRTDMQINNKIISFYNVHIPVQLKVELLLNPFEQLNDLDYRKQWRKNSFNYLIKDIEGLDTPFYISGDFNSTKSMGTMDRLLSISKDSYSVSSYLFPA